MTSTRIVLPPTDVSRWFHRLIFFLLALLVFAAPVVRGGNRQVALAGLLALSFVIVALLLADRSYRALFTRSSAAAFHDRSPLWGWLLIGVATSPVWIGVLQLVPLSADIWVTLAGRLPYWDALRSAGVDVAPSLPLSLNPSATVAAMWAGLPAGAALLAATGLSDRQARSVLRVLLVAAGVQMVVAALQFALGPDSLLYFGAVGHQVIGTFANRNHLAEFLALLTPVWFYFLVRRGAKDDTDPRPRLRIPQGLQKPLLIALGLTMVVITLTTASRGGSIAMSISLLLSLALHGAFAWRRLGRVQRMGTVALALLLVVLVVGFVELDRLGRRVESDVVQSDATVRWAYTVSTFQAGLAFWPWGSGMGTFESVFPRFQALESVGYINQAHNDYAQVWMETGLAGVLVAVALIALVVRQAGLLARAIRAEGRLPAPVALRCYSGLGLVGALVHSWAEYNLYTPALAITAATLLGLYLRPLPTRANDRASPHDN